MVFEKTVFQPLVTNVYKTVTSAIILQHLLQNCYCACDRFVYCCRIVIVCVTILYIVAELLLCVWPFCILLQNCLLCVWPFCILLQNCYCACDRFVYCCRIVIVCVTILYIAAELLLCLWPFCILLQNCYRVCDHFVHCCRICCYCCSVCDHFVYIDN